MAKFCINCGKKIGFMDDSFRLQHSDEVFCADCMEESKALLEDIKNVISVERYKDVKEKFERDIDVCRLPEKVKKYIQYDFDCIAQEAMEYLISLGTEESFASIYRFSAGFQESFDAVVEVGKKIGDSGASIVKPYVITAGEGKIATFVFESYFLRTGSYASLTVTLVNYQGVSTLTVIGSGGGDGLFNSS